MKKEIKSYEELTKCHLKHFTAIFDGKLINGIIHVNESENCIKLQYDMDRFDCDSFIHINKSEWDKVLNNKKKYSLATLRKIIVDFEEWHPKFGEVVECSDEQDYFDEFRRNIFLFKKDGVFHVLDREKDAIKSFNSVETDDQGYTVYKYKFIRPIEEPKLELNWEEAIQIIADAKCIKSENVNLKIK